MRQCPKCGDTCADEAPRCACGFELAPAPEATPDRGARWAGILGIISGPYWAAMTYALNWGSFKYGSVALPVLLLALALPVMLVVSFVGACLSIAGLWRTTFGRTEATNPTRELLDAPIAGVVTGLVGNLVVPIALLVLLVRGAFDP